MPDKVKGEKTRVKDEHEANNHIYGTLGDNMKGFMDEVYLLDDGKYKDIRLTSGKRDASPSEEFSHHHNGDAVDIAAIGIGGLLGNELFSRLNNTDDGLNLMNKYGLGIYDETDPANLKKTGGTGPHFHIGKDKGLYANTSKRLNVYNSSDGAIIDMFSFLTKNPGYDYKSKRNASASTNQEIVPPEDFSNTYVDPNSARTFAQAIQNQKDIDEKIDKKISESEARKRVEKAKIEKAKADIQIKKNFIKSISDLAAPSPGRAPVEKAGYKEEKFEEIPIQNSLPKLPSIQQLPDFSKLKYGGEIGKYTDGGVNIIGEVDPTDPPKKTKKQIEQEQHFKILNALRGTYQHLDQDTQSWGDNKEMDFGGSKTIKGADDYTGRMKVSTEDFITWKVDGISFKPEPTSFIDMGITGLKREDFETDKEYETAYSTDRVVLAPREHKKYGKMYVPVGTGTTSQKIANNFAKSYATAKTKGKQIIPYYDLRPGIKGSGAAVTKRLEEKKKAYKDYRQTELGELESGIQENKYGGEVNSDSFIDLDLTDDEIMRYEQGGYKIEYL